MWKHREQDVERVLKPWGRKVPGGGTPGETGPVAPACVVGEENPGVPTVPVAHPLTRMTLVGGSSEELARHLTVSEQDADDAMRIGVFAKASHGDRHPGGVSHRCFAGGSNRSRGGGSRNERLQGRAKRQAADLAAPAGRNRQPGRPQGGSNHEGGARNRIRATGGRAW
jgi:hypothetical protein